MGINIETDEPADPIEGSDQGFVAAMGDASTEKLLRTIMSGSSAGVINIAVNIASQMESYGFIQASTEIGARRRAHKPSAEGQTSIESWFADCQDVRDAALMTAAAFLPGATYSTVVETSALFVDLLQAAHLTDATPQLPFSVSRAARLRRIGAQIETRQDIDTGITTERVVFSQEGRDSDVRRHLWLEASDLHATLTKWLRGLGQHPDADVVARVGASVGACASFDLGGIFKEIIERWARSDTPSDRLAAGHALAVASSWDKARSFALNRVDAWTEESSRAWERRAAASFCRSAWGLLEPEAALRALHRLEATKRFVCFRWAQEALSTMWIAASLRGSDMPALAGLVVSALASWSDDRPAGVFYQTPQVHLSYVLLHELDEIGEQTALLLKARDQAVFDGASKIVAVGLDRRETRDLVCTSLDALAEHAVSRSAVANFNRLMGHIAFQSNANGVARLEHRVQSWSAKHSAAFAITS